MDNVAVYAGTENVYPQMYTALKSLLLNTKMDRVYLLIETDEFPYPVPENVILINVSEQQFFLDGSPNFRNRYSYMTLLRCCLATIFQDEKQILWLDVDTIVDDDISELFEIDLGSYYYAGSMEPNKSKGIFRYINAGVLLCNAWLLRGTGKEQEIINFLNMVELPWLDQDAINLLCQGRIRLLDSIYNKNDYTLPCPTMHKIIHYASVPAEQYTKMWAYKKYEQRELPLEDKQNGD